MSSEKVKIEIELDQEVKIAIDIIAKAFGWTPQKFIQVSLKKDIEYIIQTGIYKDIQHLQNLGIILMVLPIYTLISCI